MLKNDPRKAYIARINCSHLDVAYGLYNSLRTSIADTTSSLGDTILPIDLSLTDSEISILTKYTQNQVSNAPQYLLLGATGWCKINYQTDFYSSRTAVKSPVNVTTTCEDYHEMNMFDYRTILSDNDLTIILAYAYESNYADDKVYNSRVEFRNKKFNILKIVAIIQIVTQAIMLVVTLLVYSHRGSAKDLSRIPTITLNFVAVLSMVAGISMISSCAIITQEVIATQKEIRDGLSSFGINMVTGKLYFTLVWLAFSFSCLCMLSWIVPLWCSNPPEDDYMSDEELYTSHRNTSAFSDGAEQFVARPYQESRQSKRTKLIKTKSRLFDDVHEEVYSDNENPLTGKIRQGEDDGYKGIATVSTKELSSREHSESELRKLGEKMSRKLSVRQINRSRRQRLEILPEKEETKHLLYGGIPFSNHQYPQQLPKLHGNGDLYKSAFMSQQTRNLSDPVLKTRSLLEGERTNARASNTLHPLNPFRDDEGLRDDELSVLDEQEMDYLDNTNFINKLT